MKKVITVILASMVLSACGLQGQVNDLKGRVDRIEEQQRAVQVQISNVRDAMTTADDANKAALQQQLNNLMAQLAILQGYTMVTAVVNPCGSQSPYDEVILKLSNGTVLASLTTYSGVRFSILPNGSYTTTDGSNCHFNVNNGSVTW